MNIEEGGYGTCTDENGNHRMLGMRPGTFNVVAGRAFCGPHSYIEDIISDVELTEVTPHIIGIDFHLTLGGSIAGTVMDNLLNLQEGIQVVTCEYDGGYCMDSFSADNGTYLIDGLTASNFRVWADGEGYVVEFFSETEDHNLATLVPIELGEITENINFTLSPK